MSEKLRTAEPPVEPQWLRADVKGAMAVDREKHIIKGVILAEEGPFKSEGRGEFDRNAIRTIVKMANEKNGGLKSRFAHPGLSSDGIGSFLGRFRGAYSEKIMRDNGTDEKGNKLFREVLAAKADLYLDPTSFETPNGNLGKYVEDLAESDPDAFGTSLVLQRNEEWRLDKKGAPEKDANGEDLPPLWIPTKLHASDVVDEGDATNSFLSADVLAGLPDALVRQGCELLDAQFAGKSRAFIESRLAAFTNRYLSHRFGEIEPEETEPAKTSEATKEEANAGDEALLLDLFLAEQEA